MRQEAGDRAPIEVSSANGRDLHQPGAPFRFIRHGDMALLRTGPIDNCSIACSSDKL
jgi:hypothetical protein